MLSKELVALGNPVPSPLFYQTNPKTQRKVHGTCFKKIVEDVSYLPSLFQCDEKRIVLNSRSRSREERSSAMWLSIPEHAKLLASPFRRPVNANGIQLFGNLENEEDIHISILWISLTLF